MPANNFFSFGSGDLFIVPTGVFAQNNPTPVRFGTLQEVSLEFSASQKELYGKNRFPVAVASTETKITGKAKAANINASLWNAAYFGGTPATGEGNRTALDEVATPSSNSVTVANSATFVKDLGVFDMVTGLYLVLYTGGGAVPDGSYKVAAGVYTFAAGYSNQVRISYTYTTTTGFKYQIPNLGMGSNPYFSLYLTNGQWQGIQLNLELYQCASNKLTLGWKNADFSQPEFDFFAMDNGLGFVGEFNYDQTN